MENKNELVVLTTQMDDENETKKLTTLDLSKNENKVLLYNALQNCDLLLKDCKNQKIKMCNVYIEEYKKENLDEKTGEVKKVSKFRTIIFDESGKTYATGSYGVYNSIRQIVGIFGNPSNENPILVEVGERDIDKNKKSLILTMVQE